MFIINRVFHWVSALKMPVVSWSKPLMVSTKWYETKQFRTI